MPPENTDIVEAVRNLIVADSGVTSRLATYEFTTGVPSAAVFTTEVIPRNCDRPAVLANRGDGGWYGTRGRKGHESVVEVRLLGNRDRAHDALRRTANLLRRLLNRATLEVTDGYSAFRCIAEPPAMTSDADGFPGYLVTVRVLQLAAHPVPEPVYFGWDRGLKWDAGLKWR